MEGRKTSKLFQRYVLVVMAALLNGCWIDVHEHQVFKFDDPIVTVDAIAYPIDDWSDWYALRSYKVTNTSFNHTFRARVMFPDYYEFYMFRPGFKHLCQGKTQPICETNLGLFSGNPDVETYIRTTEDTYFLGPIARPRNCTGLYSRGIGDEMRLCAGTYDLDGDSIVVSGDAYLDPGVTIKNGWIYSNGLFINGGVKLVDAHLTFTSSQSYVNGLTMTGYSQLLSSDHDGTEFGNLSSDNGRESLVIENILIGTGSVVIINNAIGYSGFVVFRNIQVGSGCAGNSGMDTIFQASPGHPGGSFKKEVIKRVDEMFLVIEENYPVFGGDVYQAWGYCH